MCQLSIISGCTNNKNRLLELIFLFVSSVVWSDQPWTEILELTDLSATQPAIKAWENDVYIVWSDDRLASKEIFFRHSTNAGENWSIDQRVTRTSADSVEPDIELDNRYLYLVWQEDQAIKFALYDGEIWKNQSTLSTSGRRPRISATKTSPNNFIYVVWEQIPTPNSDPLVGIQAKISISDDKGNTWRKPRPLTGQWQSAEPDVAAGFQTSTVVWRDHREATGQIYAQQYQGLVGSTHWRLSSSGHARRPMVVMSNYQQHRFGEAFISVAWESRLQPLDPADIWVAQNFDSRQPNIYQIEQITNNSAESISPQISLSSDRTWLFWRDGRSGDWQLYFSDYDFKWSANKSFLPSNRFGPEISPAWIAVSAYKHELQLVWLESKFETSNHLFYQRIDKTPPQKPSRPIHVDLDAPSGFDNDQNLTFIWDKVAESIMYHIWVSIDQAKFEEISQIDLPRYDYQPLVNNKSYRIQIQAADSVGNRSQFSPPSEPIYVDYHPPKLQLHTPTSISANNTKDDQIPVIVSQKVVVTATCLDDNLVNFQLRLGNGRLPSLSDNWKNLGPPIRTSFEREQIYVWDTTGLDGIYTLSLTAVDAIQNQTKIQSLVIIDNHQPLPISGGLDYQVISNQTDVSDYTPAWSPDGKFIAFSSNAAGSVDIWILALDSGQRSRLTKDQWIDLYPSWHPNGEVVTFQSKRPQPDSTQLDWEIWSVNINGSGLHRQLDRPARTASWSPTGDQLAVTITHNGNDEIFLAQVTSSPVTYQQLTRNNYQDTFPSWSPDMVRIAFQSNRAGNWDVLLLDVDQSDETTEQLLRQSFANETQPRWAPNGKYLLFLTDRFGQSKTAVSTLLDPLTRQAKLPAQLTPIGTPVDSACWSPSIKQLVYQSKDQLHIVPIVFPMVYVEAQIVTPYNRDIVSGKVELIGLARGPKFLEFSLHYAEVSTPVRTWVPIGGRSTQPVSTTGFLGQWDTRRLRGEYILRLTVISSHPDGNQIVIDEQTVLVENHKPTLEIFSPYEGKITDQQMINLTGKTSSDAQLYVNNDLIATETSGLFSARILLNEGRNLLHIRAISPVLGTTEMYRTIVRDVQAPFIELSQPSDFTISPVPYILVSGTTDSSELQIQQQSTKSEKTITISIESDGVFSQNLGLQIGTNTIVLLAKDEFGRHSRLLRRVVYNMTETKNLVGQLAPIDIYPPGIIDLHPSNGQILTYPKGKIAISCYLLDNVQIDPLSLIFDFDNQTFYFDPDTLEGGEKEVQIASFDGNTFTFDPETSKFTYRPVQELSQGKHTLKLQVRDLEGNLSAPVTSNFTIDRQPFYASLSAIRDGNDLCVHLVSNKILKTIGNSKVTVTPLGNRESFHRIYSIDLQLVTLEKLEPKATRQMVKRRAQEEGTDPELESLFIYQGKFRLNSQADSFDISADFSLTDEQSVMLRRLGYYTDQNQFQSSSVLPFPQKKQGYHSILLPYQIYHPRGASLTFLSPQMNLKPQLSSQSGFDSNRVLSQLQNAESRQLEIIYPVHEIKLDVTSEVFQNSSFELRIPSKKSEEMLESTALFYWQKNWLPVPKVRKIRIDDQVYFVAVVEKLGSYGLLIDQKIPMIGSFRKNEQLIELTITDNGSGIDRLSVKIDEEPAVILTSSQTDQNTNREMRFQMMDSFSGKLTYLPGNLFPGRHTLNVEAFDRAGNMAQFENVFFSRDIFDFVDPVFAYPNPATRQAQINFQLTRVADIELIIYSVSGEKVYSTTLSNVSGSNTSLKWNCCNQNQQPVTTGIYIFDLTATNSGRSIRRSGKIAVLHPNTNDR